MSVDFQIDCLSKSFPVARKRSKYMINRLNSKHRNYGTRYARLKGILQILCFRQDCARKISF